MTQDERQVEYLLAEIDKSVGRKDWDAVKRFTNQEIGDLLHISIKTVATHVTHIYEKTGCSNRAEAGAYAIRTGVAGE